MWGALGITAMAAGACEQGEQFEASRSWTSTVTLGQQRILEIHAPVTLGIEGLPRTSELVLDMEAVATASSATVARQLVDNLDWTIDDDGRRLRVTGDNFQPNQGTIQGVLIVRLPDDMDLEVFGLGGPVQIFDVEGDITVNAATHTELVRTSGNATVRLEQGNALIDSAVSPGSVIDVVVNAGDVQLTAPLTVSAQIGAVTNQGQIFIRHAGLPNPIQGLPYQVTVGGGLSRVSLGTRRGNILIQSP